MKKKKQITKKLKLRNYSNPSSKYNFIKKIVDGSASTIYLGQCKVLDNTNTNTNINDDDGEEEARVIIKRIPKNEEWSTELNILKKLPKNDHILNFRDYYIMERYVYLVTDFYQGFDLFEHIDLNVPYDREWTVKLVREMAKCIKVCHDAGIAHLDIKCENFMVLRMRPEPYLILIDFGHAERIGDENRSKVLFADFKYGTCFYLCPEGYNRQYSFWSDIWSLGICTHLILTGDYPFEGGEDEYRSRISKGKMSYNPKVKGDALEFIKGCLELNPSRRLTIGDVLEHKFLSA